MLFGIFIYNIIKLKSLNKNYNIKEILNKINIFILCYKLGMGIGDWAPPPIPINFIKGRPTLKKLIVTSFLLYLLYLLLLHLFSFYLLFFNFFYFFIFFLFIFFIFFFFFFFFFFFIFFFFCLISFLFSFINNRSSSDIITIRIKYKLLCNIKCFINSN